MPALKSLRGLCLLACLGFWPHPARAEKPEIFVQLGHNSTVYSVAFSPDGKLAVWGSMDNNLKLWSAESGREIRTLRGHGSYIQHVAFSPDGKRLVSSSQDASIRLWDVETGLEAGRCSQNAYTTFTAFGPEGALAFNRFEALVTWNTQSGETRKYALPPKGGDVVAALFSKDGKSIIAANRAGFFVLDLQTGTVQRTFGPKDLLREGTPIAFSPDGRYAITGEPNVLVLYDTQTGAAL